MDKRQELSPCTWYNMQDLISEKIGFRNGMWDESAEIWREIYLSFLVSHTENGRKEMVEARFLS